MVGFLKLARCVVVIGAAITIGGISTLHAAPPAARVRVDVECDDQNAKNELQSALEKQLRDFGDVAIVEENYDYRIEVEALVPVLRDRTSTNMLVGAFSFFVPISKVVDRTLTVGKVCLPETIQKELKLVRAADMHVQSGVISDSLSDVSGMARSMVASFDVKCLRVFRSAFVK